MATTQQAQCHQTKFKVGSVAVTFGIMWPDAGFLMNDWNRPSKIVDLDGPSLTVTQLVGFGPRRVTYRLFFETIADYRTMEGLQQQTGVLTLVHGGHTVEVAPEDTHAILKRAYDRLPDVTLLSLVSLGVAPDGTVESDASFQVSA